MYANFQEDTPEKTNLFHLKILCNVSVADCTCDKFNAWNMRIIVATVLLEALVLAQADIGWGHVLNTLLMSPPSAAIWQWSWGQPEGLRDRQPTLLRRGHQPDRLPWIWPTLVWVGCWHNDSGSKNWDYHCWVGQWDVLVDGDRASPALTTTQLRDTRMVSGKGHYGIQCMN